MTPDWSEIFGLTVSPIELVVRGTAIFRVVVRRRIGAVGMAGEYRSVTDGAILVGTIIAWNWVIEPPPLPLVQDGRLLHRNLRREFVTEEELNSKLRDKGVRDRQRHQALSAFRMAAVIDWRTSP